MQITVGREPGTEHPRLKIECDGNSYFLGAPGSVDKGVSRQHCRLDVNSEGSIVSISDITENNFMHINGREYKSKKNVTFSDTVELGLNKYKLDLESIVNAVNCSKSYSIAPLEGIYNKYQQDLIKLQIEQGKISVLSTIPMMISMASGVVVAIIPDMASDVRVVMIVIAFCIMVLFFFVRMRLVKEFPLKRRKLDDDFRNNYVCPNPSCRQFLGSLRPDELRKKRTCPVCKSKYKD